MRFDIDRYKDVVDRLDDGDVDYTDFADRPLPEDALRCVRYMHDIESHTACYLRDLLATRAHRDPDITAFMTCWAYEELWHAEALGRVLEAHGETAGTERVRVVRERQGLADRLRPLAMTITSALSTHMTAVHMAWGAVNEWTTQAGYARLAQRAEHPALTALLRRIMRQEGRHIDFYASQAAERLERSGPARRLTRAALRRLWAPVGSGVMADREVSHLIRWLFGGPDGEATARRLDRNIGRLPGLAGLELVSGARARHVVPGPTGTLAAA